MAEVRDKATGEIVKIADDEIGEYVLKGYQVRPGTLVPIMVEGKLKGIAAEEVGSIEEIGGHIATGAQVAEERKQREFGEGLGAARGGVEALARGATVGLSDVAATGLGADAEGLRERRERSGALGTGLEVAGTVAPLLLSGGTSALARGAAAVGAPARAVAGTGLKVGEAVTKALGGPTSRIARMAGQGAAATVEGGGFGAGMAASEAALDDSPLTAERLLAHIGTGAVLGGATGGLLGGLSRGPRARLGRGAEVIDEAIPEGAIAAGVADDVLGGAAARSAAGEVVEEGAEAGSTALARRGVPGSTALVDDAAEAASAGSARLDAMLGEARGAPGAGRATPESASVGAEAASFFKDVAKDTVDKVADLATPTNLDDLSKKFAYTATRPSAKHLREARAFSGPNFVTEIGETIRDEVPKRLGKPIEKITQEDLYEGAKLGREEFGEMMGGIITRADEAMQKAGRHDLMAYPDEVYAVLKRDLLEKMEGADAGASQRRLAKAIRDELDPWFENRAGRSISLREMKDKQLQFKADAGKRLKRVGDETGEAFNEAAGILEREVEQGIERATNEFGLTGDYKYAKRKWSHLKSAEDATRDAIDRDTKNRLFSLSDYVGGSAAMAGGAAFGLGPGALLLGLGVGSINKIARERGNMIASGFLSRFSKTDGLRKVAEKTGARVKSAVDRAFGDAPRAAASAEAPRAASARAATSGPARKARSGAAEVVDRAPAGAIVVTSRAPATAKERTETFTREVKEAAHLASNPGAVVARVNEALGEDAAQIAPATTAAAVAAVLRGVEFLQSKSPRADLRASDILSGNADRQRVSDTEQAKFLRYVDAVKNPAEVIEDFGNGTVTPEAAEALRVVYPEMFAELEREILSKLADPETSPSYHSLTRASRLLGRPLHPTHEPAFIAAIQSMHAASRGPNETSSGAPSSTPATMTGAEPTTAQRVSAGGN